MKRHATSKQGDQTWVVTSGVRLLPASLRQPLATIRPVPRPAPLRKRQRRDTPTRLCLVPLSRRPVFYDR